MKCIPIILLALVAAVAAKASTIEDLLGPAINGVGTAYFRIVLEKKGGIDMRENVIPKSIIQAVEKEGAAVRPTRSNVNVSYWIFFRNGDFATCDVVNNPTMTNLTYAKLKEFLADAPHDGPKWSREGDDLVIGRRYYSVRLLTANDPATGGRKGEMEVAVLDGREKVYYYFGNPVQN